MSDSSVASALRSSARLVVIEAPAGCGKTFQGAQYARDMAGMVGNGRVLVLAHTHAACSEFAKRTCGVGTRVEIRTIDSLITQIAGAYHQSLGLPADAGAWAQSQEEGYSLLADKVDSLLRASPAIAQSLAWRYPVIIFDEHQDASAAQHAVGLACYESGSAVRIFGDPMQRIHGSRRKTIADADEKRWEDLKEKADVFDCLEEPHRWKDGADALGGWILKARAALKKGESVDLRGPLPEGVLVAFADNLLPNARIGYRLTKEEAKPIRAIADLTGTLLVLATQNKTASALRSFFGRQLPIWEGHVRENLAELVKAAQEHSGHPVEIAEAMVEFLTGVATGFSPSAFGNILIDEVRCGCAANRKGKPGILQELGREILNEPDHRGVSKVLHRLRELSKAHPAFRAVKIDGQREFSEAVRVGKFDDLAGGLAEMTRQRSYCRASPPAKAISTVHKAKGLECSHALIVPCDTQHFSDTKGARCRLYVAMSRAKRSVTFVVPRKNPSPLLMV